MEFSLQLITWRKEFRDAWKAGTPLDICQFVADCLPKFPAGSDRDEFLIELLSVDLEFRWKQDAPDRRTLDDYLRIFPERTLSDLVQRALLLEEIRHRRAAGERPEPADYIRRMTALGASESELGEVNKSYGSTSAAGSSGVSHQLIPRLSRYVIHELIGRGAMGAVYRATHRPTKIPVALKILTSSDPEIVKRFIAEAEAAMKLSHPNIVRVTDVDCENATHFIRMELIRGVDLEKHVGANQTLSATEAVRLLVPIADAIDVANKEGVVHRDIKPGNILIDQNGIPHVTDFGLAKQFRLESHDTDPMTCDGQILGTPEYMPPEQASGDPHQVNRRADVYSLGAVLYRLVTGRPPFKGANPLDTIRQVMDEETISPRRLAPGIPHDLETIIMRCLCKAPRLRYISAGALRDDLQRFLNGESIIARRAGMGERLTRFTKQHRVLTVAFLMLASIAAIQVCWILKDQQQSWAAQQVFHQQQRDYELKESELGAQKRETLVAQTKHYAAELQHALKLIRSGDLDGAEQALDRNRHSIQGWSKIAGIEWDWLKSLSALRGLKTVPVRGPLQQLAVLSFDEPRFLVAGTHSNTIQQLTRRSRVPGPFLSGPDFWQPQGLSSMALSKDGRLLAIASLSSQLQIIGLDPIGRESFRFGVQLDHFSTSRQAPSVLYLSSISFNSDGARLLVGDTHGNVVLCEDISPPESRRPFEQLTQSRVASLSSRITSISSHTDGNMYVAASIGQIIRVRPDGSSESVKARADSYQVRSVCVSPDGNWLAIAGSSGLQLMELAGGHIVDDVDDSEHARSCHCIAWSKDGMTLAAGFHDGFVRFIDRETLDVCGQIEAHRAPVQSVALFGDSVLSVGEDGTFCQWPMQCVNTFIPLSLSTSVEESDSANNLVELDKKLDAPGQFQIPVGCECRRIVSIDEQRAILVLSGARNSIGLWDRLTGEHLLPLMESKSRVAAVGWNPRGNILSIRDSSNRVRHWRGPLLSKP